MCSWRWRQWRTESSSEATSTRDGESSESASVRKSRWPSRLNLNKSDSEYTIIQRKEPRRNLGQLTVRNDREWWLYRWMEMESGFGETEGREDEMRETTAACAPPCQLERGGSSQLANEMRRSEILWGASSCTGLKRSTHGTAVGGYSAVTADHRVLQRVPR